MRKLKWIALTGLIAALVCVFWVVPAAGQGEQTFYLQKCKPITNWTFDAYTMSQQMPPPECCSDVQIDGCATWVADVPVTTETVFQSDHWSGYLEYSSTTGYFPGWLAVGWIEVPCGTFHQWLNQTFNLTSSPGWVALMDHLDSWTMPPWTYFSVKVGGSDSGPVYLHTGGHTCLVIAPPSDPPYPQEPSPGPSRPPGVPTVSHWGMIGLAALLALFLVWSLTRRRKGFAGGEQ